LLRRSDGVGAVWSPDGQSILFARSSQDTGYDLWAKTLGQGGTERQLFELPGSQGPSAWPREGLVLLISEQPGAGIDAYTWDPTGDAPPRPYLDGPWNESQLQISPDGRLAAFISEERGVPDLYVREYPIPRNKWRLTTGYSAEPRWSRDGRYLWWTRGSSGSGIDTVYRARVERAPAVTFGTPDVMYHADIDGIANWVLHPDGNRFVVIVPQGGGMAKAGSGSEATLRFLVTLNSFDELRRALRAQRP
jgi:serine/threonine-protein kinase